MKFFCRIIDNKSKIFFQIFIAEFYLHCWTKWQWKVKCHRRHVVCVWFPCQQDQIQETQCINP